MIFFGLTAISQIKNDVAEYTVADRGDAMTYPAGWLRIE